MTRTDPLALLDTLTDELTGAGWTREPDPATQPGFAGATHRLLTAPHGAAQLHATAYRHNRELLTTLTGLDPDTGSRAPLWHAVTAALPASVLIAAAHAACAPPRLGVEVRLAQAGWNLAVSEYEGSRLLEQRWVSPGAIRSASWFPPDLPFDTGGWILTRPDQQDRRAQLHICADTPHAVTAALALAD
jgi:hypothetical protein